MLHSSGRLRLWAQFMLAFLVVISVILSVASGLFYTQGRGIVLALLRERLTVTASMAAHYVDGDLFSQVRSEEHPGYHTIKDALMPFRNADPKIRDVYSMRPIKGNTWEYVVDTEPRDSKIFTPCAHPYDVSVDPANAEGLKSPSASQKVYRDEYGDWLSGYAPIRNKAGQAVGTVAFDMSASQVLEEEHQIRRMAMIIFFLGLLLAVVASVLMARILNRPIGQLVDGARKVSQGDLTIRVPETRQDELGELASAFNAMLSDLARQREDLKEQERMSQELATARKIQQAMLPTEPPDSGSLNIDFYAESASEVGGDYFDFLPLENGKMAFAIGDVTGHGVPAALLMAMVKSCLHTQVLANHRVADVMAVANNTVHKSTYDRRLMTFFYSILDIRTGTLTFANAGHLHPYLFRAATGEVLTLASSSYPLGVRPNVAYPEQTIQLEVGDLLVFYSDGIIEAQNPRGEEFGFDRMEALIQELGAGRANELVHELLKRWRSFVFEGNVQPTEDDVTVVAVKFVSNECEEGLVCNQDGLRGQSDTPSLAQ